MAPLRERGRGRIQKDHKKQQKTSENNIPVLGPARNNKRPQKTTKDNIFAGWERVEKVLTVDIYPVVEHKGTSDSGVWNQAHAVEAERDERSDDLRALSDNCPTL
jgi:hypothetical protein